MRIVVDAIDKSSGIARLEMGGKLVEVSTELIPDEAIEGTMLKFVVEDPSEVNEYIRNLFNKVTK